MSEEEIGELLSQYPDSYKIGIVVSGIAVPIGMNIGDLTVLLSKSERVSELESAMSWLGNSAHNFLDCEALGEDTKDVRRDLVNSAQEALTVLMKVREPQS